MNLYHYMTPEERKKDLKFREKHKKKKCFVYYIVYSTGGIGEAIHAVCEHCKKEKDITDYGTW